MNANKWFYSQSFNGGTRENPADKHDEIARELMQHAGQPYFLDLAKCLHQAAIRLLAGTSSEKQYAEQYLRRTVNG